MTVSGAFIPAVSSKDSFHMCSPVGEGFRKQSRGSVVRKGLPQVISPHKQSPHLLFYVALLLSLFLSVLSQTVDEFTVDRTALNQQIQVAAFKSFPRRVKTGTVYDATLPGNLSAMVDVRMVRFRTGRLRRTGFQFQEVNLPVGVKVDKYMRHVVLVYRSFKVDTNFHNITSGTQLVGASAIVGVHVYNGSNLTFLDPLPELKVSATERPIEVTVNLKKGRVTNVTCVLFDDTGFMLVSNFTSPPKTCVYETLGDFALLSPLLEDIPGKGSNNNTWKIALGAVAGGVLLLAFLWLVALMAVRYRERAKFAKMERVADHGETLQHTLVGDARAPAAASTRTKPVLEGDYVS